MTSGAMDRHTTSRELHQHAVAPRAEAAWTGDVSMSNDRAADASYHATLSSDELRRIDAWWRACNYLSVGMIYLRDNPLLRERLPELRLRFVNVVDLFRMQPVTEHPHGSTEREFDSLFTVDKPVIFNFHGYPWLIHKLAYRFRNHENLHVRGYTEKGNINTPLELAILNKVDRFNLVLDVLDRVPRLQGRTAHLRDDMRNSIILNMNYAHEHGTDSPEISEWVWPY
jgi:xylulose-5-phosphate/fructose-6-phosphate phosphoketolase